MFRINPFKPSREEKHVPNKVKASIRTNPITVSQPLVITKKVVNSDSNGLSSTGVDNTKTRRLQPRSNTKNDRVPSASKSSRSKNTKVEVEEHHRKLMLSRNKKHMSYECNNVKLATQNVKSKVVCAMCKEFLISVNHDKQKANVSINETQKKQQPKVKKTKKVGSIKRLTSPKPSKPRSCFRWSPTGRFFDLKGKIITSSESESQSDNSKGDNACNSNPLEPTIRQFPNSTFSLAGNPNMFMVRRLGNDHVAAILGFDDLQWGNILITRVYFVEGLGHNLFSVGQFCDSDLEVAFRRNACFVRNLEGVDLLSGNRTTNLYTINLHKMASASLICLMARASSTKSWLWHQQAARTMLIFSRAPLFLWAEAIATACLTQNRSIIHRRFNKIPYELINGKNRISPSFMYLVLSVIPRMIVKILRSLVQKKIMETMNVSFDELSAMAFEQRSSKPGLQSMTSGQISLGLDLTYASSTITTQQPTEGDLDLLFKAMYDDYIGGQPSSSLRTVPTAQAHQVRQTPTTSTSIADTAPTPTDSSSQATNFPNSSQDVDGLNSQQQLAQQQGNQAPIQPKKVADNVPNAMFDANTFVNPFANPSISAAESSSSQYVDPLNMHTFYQPYPHEFQWTKDHPLEQVIGEPSRPVLTRNKLRSDGDMYMYALTFKRLDVWVLVPAPDNLTPLTLKWLFKNKHDEEKTFIRNKSRLVVRGYHQEEGIDFEESFAPNHFFKGTADLTLFIRRFVNDILVVQVYVDDIIFGSTHPMYTQLFSDLIKSRFKMSMMGEMMFFLGLQVNQSPCGIFISQSNYVLEILKKYRMVSCDPVGTPMKNKDKLDLYQNGTLVDATKYRSMIGALMYLTSSRPDIIHATCLCARYQSKPIEKHLKEVKRIFHYLRGTVNTGLWYMKDFGFELTGFSYDDYAGCKDTFKSTSSGAQVLGEKLVSWSSNKQDCTMLSTTEAEHVSLSVCCAKVLWMRTQLTDTGFHFNKIPIYCDSKSAISLSCNPVQHSRIKHIAVRYYFIKEHVEKGTIELYFVKTDYQLADLFTKAFQ
nr:hypothetical protein [Tanacetum cinerariifolium]